MTIGGHHISPFHYKSYDSMTPNPTHIPKVLIHLLYQTGRGNNYQNIFLAQRNILLMNKSSEICLTQWEISIVFGCVLEHRILPRLGIVVTRGRL